MLLWYFNFIGIQYGSCIWQDYGYDETFEWS